MSCTFGSAFIWRDPKFFNISFWPVFVFLNSIPDSTQNFATFLSPKYCEFSGLNCTCLLMIRDGVIHWFLWFRAEPRTREIRIVFGTSIKHGLWWSGWVSYPNSRCVWQLHLMFARSILQGRTSLYSCTRHLHPLALLESRYRRYPGIGRGLATYYSEWHYRLWL